MNRRKSVQLIGSGLAGYSLIGASSFLSSCGGDAASKEQQAESTSTMAETTETALFFNISLAQWSLHKSFFGPILENGFDKWINAMQTDPDSALQGELDPLNFPVIARQEYGVDTIELVNTFYFTKAKIWR